MNALASLILIACVAIAACVRAQFTPYINPLAPTTNLVSRVASNGVVTITYEVQSPCFAAVYRPDGGACKCNYSRWSESFTNNPVKP